MLILRPCRMADLPAVARMAAASGIGITSLPADRKQLGEKIERSTHSFAADAQANGDEQYFFVLENIASRELVGTSALVASAGIPEPFYSYRHEIIVHASQELGVSNQIHALHLCHDLTGCSLLTSFYIDPACANANWPQLLSRARLLFIAAHRQRFADKLAAEHPGVCDDAGRSPFWDAVGRRFFNIDYPQAERLSGGRSKTFIAELMPQYPIYVPLLPEGARRAIGRLHARAELPYSILRAEGFEAGTYIDIFDGGPTVEARTATVRSIVASRTARARIGVPAAAATTQPCIIANAGAVTFAATIAEVAIDARNEVSLPATIAGPLGLADGGDVRLVPL